MNTAVGALWLLIKGIRISIFSRAINREHIKVFALLIRVQSSPSHTDAIKKKSAVTLCDGVIITVDSLLHPSSVCFHK